MLGEVLAHYHGIIISGSVFSLSSVTMLRLRFCLLNKVFCEGIVIMLSLLLWRYQCCSMNITCAQFPINLDPISLLLPLSTDSC